MNDIAGTTGTIFSVVMSLAAVAGVIYGLIKQIRTDSDARQAKLDAGTIAEWRDYAETQRVRADTADAACTQRVDRLEKAHAEEVVEYRARLQQQQDQITSMAEDRGEDRARIAALEEALRKRGIRIARPGDTDHHKPLPPGGQS